MSEEFAGQQKAFVEGYSRALKEVQKLILEKSEKEIFSIHYFGKGLINDITTLLRKVDNHVE